MITQLSCCQHQLGYICVGGERKKTQGGAGAGGGRYKAQTFEVCLGTAQNACCSHLIEQLYHAGSALLPGSTPGLHARAFGSSSQGPSAKSLQRHQAAAAAAAAASSQPVAVHVGPLSAADARTDRQAQPAQQALPAFVKAKAFSGPKAGYAFKKGSKGLGYYLEAGAVSLPVSKPQKESEVLLGKSGLSKKQQQQQARREDEEAEAGALSDEDMQPVKGMAFLSKAS